MSVLHLNEENFNSTVEGAAISMVDFWAEWCGPCKMIGPVIDELGATYEGKAVVAKVNVDESPKIAEKFGVMTIPTIVFLKNGEEIDRKIGVQPAAAYAEVLDANI